MFVLNNRTDPKLSEVNFHARLCHLKQSLKNIHPMTLASLTARRNARIAIAVLAIAIPSVRLSVTRRCCVKTTARTTVQFALSDSKVVKMCPFPLKSWLRVTYPLLIAASLDTFGPYSASTVRASEKKFSIITNRKSFTGFPTSYR